MARATADRAVLDGRLLPIRAAKMVGILNDALEKVSRVSSRSRSRTRAELEAARGPSSRGRVGVPRWAPCTRATPP